MAGVLVVLGVTVLAGGAGAALRWLLGRLRRGMTVRPGPIELTTAAVTLIGVGLTGGTPRLPLIVLAGLLLVGLSWIDIAHHRLPDALTWPALPLALATVAAVDLAVPEAGSLLRAIVCGAALFALFGVVSRISPRSMGRGDVKLVPTLGVLTGYLSVATTVIAVALAFVLAAVVAIGGLALRRMRMSSALPFGPFLLVGAWAAIALPRLADLVTG